MLNLIFRERRTIESTVAWILILTVIPAAGFFIYLAFGRRINKDNMFKLKKEEDKRCKNRVIETNNFLQYSNRLEPEVLEHRDIIYSLTNSNSAAYTTNNQVSIYTDGNELFDELIYQIKQATKYIHIEFYIFKDDELGNRIIDVLLDKLSQGVEVRLLYDSVGSRLFSNKSINKVK
jgi:cardiolipin synthase